MRGSLRWFNPLCLQTGHLTPKVILSTLPDTDEDTRKAAMARGKLRYSRFLKSVGANIVGDAQAALSELVNRAPEE